MSSLIRGNLSEWEKRPLSLEELLEDADAHSGSLPPGLSVAISTAARKRDELDTALEYALQAYETTKLSKDRSNSCRYGYVLAGGNWAYTLVAVRRYQEAANVFLEVLREVFLIDWSEIHWKQQGGKLVDPFVREFLFLTGQLPRVFRQRPELWQQAVRTILDAVGAQGRYNQPVVMLLLAELYQNMPPSDVDRRGELMTGVCERGLGGSLWAKQIFLVREGSVQERLMLLLVNALWIQGKNYDAFELICFLHERFPNNTRIELVFLDFQRKMLHFSEAVELAVKLSSRNAWAKMIHAHTLLSQALSIHARGGEASEVKQICSEAERVLRTFSISSQNAALSIRYHCVVVFLQNLFFDIGEEPNAWLKEAYRQSSSEVLEMSEDYLLSFQIDDVRAAQAIARSAH